MAVLVQSYGRAVEQRFPKIPATNNGCSTDVGYVDLVAVLTAGLQLAHTDVEVFEDDRHGHACQFEINASCSPLDWPVMLTLAAVISLAWCHWLISVPMPPKRRSRPVPRSVLMAWRLRAAATTAVSNSFHSSRFSMELTTMPRLLTITVWPVFLLTMGAGTLSGRDSLRGIHRDHLEGCWLLTCVYLWNT